MRGFGEQKTSKKKINNITKPYKEKIINQAFHLHSQGNISEAAKYYKYFIKQGFKNAVVFSNYGVILKKLGKLQEAELSYRKAIEIKPDYAEAYYSLGHTLKDLCKFQDAFDSYLKVTQINPSFSNIYQSINRFLRDSDPSQLNKLKLKNILNLLLEKNNVSHRELFNAFNFIYGNEIISNLEKFDSDFSAIELIINDKVIINALKKIIFNDLKLEKELTKVRRNICHRISRNTETINDSELKFIITLGQQCFLNEYIYSLTEEEKVSRNLIIKRCQDNELNETNISILSCYFPLYKLLDQIPSLKSFTSSNQNFKELICIQIIEPLKEIKLSKNIQKLGSINDDVSQKVKSQYETNPYPRWRYGHQINKISSVQAINNDIKPNSINNNLGNKQLKVLVAGCGTGQNVLNTQRYDNSHITGIDLSLSSLSYAQRKMNELKIDNVELIQMDILEVSLLKKQFDIIECIGVLHHMGDPSNGLRALLDILKNNGFLKLGLYSELARKDVVKARSYIARKKIQPNEDNIRSFRQKIISRKLKDLDSFETSLDFYSLSECRDLCFNVQEHRFTINKLQETFKSNELEFLGFHLPKPVKSLFKQYFPEDRKQTNLQNWKKFEQKHPNTFRGMYQFWVSKQN